MSGFLYSFVGFFLAVSILVTFHELGHFSVARFFDVKVLRFSIGFGKPIWIRTFGPDQTEFVVSAIPLGGYVRMLDERAEEVELEDDNRTFNSKTLFARAAILVAGPLANFLLAAVLFWLSFIIGVPGFSPVVGHVLPGGLGETLGFKIGDEIVAVDQRGVQTWNEFDLYFINQSAKMKEINFELLSTEGAFKFIRVKPSFLPDGYVRQSFLSDSLGLYPRFPASPAHIGKVVDGSPAQLAGLQIGDIVEAVDGMPIRTWSSLVESVSERPGQMLNIQLLRDEEEVTIQVVPELTETNYGPVGRIGVMRDLRIVPAESVRLDVLQSLKRSLENTWIVSGLTVRALVEMVRRKISTERLGGPITIARVAGQSAKTGFVPYLLFLALISISLGILNLLPIPMLDGGHLVYLMIEGIRGSPLSPEAIHIGQRLGIVILAMLMLVALYNDLAGLGL